ncbi:uncharacterized protein TNCT_495431 [Trichonephila clavata]|uniref:RRM domain-containing protein n=1 Tax=Trichonephila clavata TaxID=2740835 RepID=A0A8X6KF80_TRICU|nr:uncharacterized protein TNCT_495431 [Trichonephila clavata]
MSCKVYVGNYPSTFSQKDILYLFQDFEGIEMVGFFKNKQKCFSFLHCVDQDQVVDVVTTMHDIDVCGRNLIVRSSDETLQKAIEESFVKNGVLETLHPRNKCNQSSTSSNSFSKTKFSKDNESTTIGYWSNTDANNSKTQNTYSQNNFQTSTEQNYDSVSSPGSHYYSSNTSGPKFPEKHESDYSRDYFAASEEKGRYDNNKSTEIPQCHGYNEDLMKNINPQETFLKYAKPKSDPTDPLTMSDKFASYSQKSYNQQNAYNGKVGGRNAHQNVEYGEGHPVHRRGKSYNEHPLEIANPAPETVILNGLVIPKDELSFVSVLNFPLGLPTRDLYELFTDYNPVKIFIVCNKARMDRTPTEAIICFTNEKDATNAILNLDNTVYRGRVLLVTDAVNMVLVSELLSFGGKILTNKSVKRYT